MPFYTPLRYPGGKRKLANFFKFVINKNRLSDGHYIEIYAGGAAVALELLFDEYVSHIHINDIDRSIYAFWHSAIYENEDLCDLIQNTSITIDEWYRQREIQEQASNTSLLALGFSTFFLNRTNRSGIILGGVIGGKYQEGTYKISARFNKNALIKRIQRIGRYRNRITIYNDDAAYFINNTLNNLPSSALVYLDPPYYSKGEDLYKNFYKHQDHKQIANLLAHKANLRWIVTYDNMPEIRDMYSDYPYLIYDLHYSVANRYQGSEVMFLCNDLEIPPVDNPAKVTKRMLMIKH